MVLAYYVLAVVGTAGILAGAGNYSNTGNVRWAAAAGAVGAAAMSAVAGLIVLGCALIWPPAPIVPVR